jgi:putative membrane protein
MSGTKGWLLGGLLTLGAVLLFAPGLLSGFGAGGYASHGGMMGSTGGMMGGYGGAMGGSAPVFGFLGPLIPLLVVLLVVGGGVVLVQAALDENDVEIGTADDAIEELRAAYARGDLSEAEFESRLATLREHENE